MAEKEAYNWERHSPAEVKCRKCRGWKTAATRGYSVGQTGTIDHLYLCLDCGWGTIVRYDWKKPRYHIPISVVSPGKKSLGYLLPKKKGKV